MLSYRSVTLSIAVVALMLSSYLAAESLARRNAPIVRLEDEWDTLSNKEKAVLIRDCLTELYGYIDNLDQRSADHDTKIYRLEKFCFRDN